MPCARGVVLDDARDRPDALAGGDAGFATVQEDALILKPRLRRTIIKALSADLPRQALDDAGRREESRAALEALARRADVFLEGYRSGALATLRFDVDRVAALRPGIIYASISCYGHQGPSLPGAAGRPGQAATGLSVTRGDDAAPRLAPVLRVRLPYRLSSRARREARLRRAKEGGSWTFTLRRASRHVACRHGRGRGERRAGGARPFR